MVMTEQTYIFKGNQKVTSIRHYSCHVGNICAGKSP